MAAGEEGRAVSGPQHQYPGAPWIVLPVVPFYTPPAGGNVLLLETGDRLLLETGDNILLEA